MVLNLDSVGLTLYASRSRKARNELHAVNPVLDVISNGLLVLDADDYRLRYLDSESI